MLLQWPTYFFPHQSHFDWFEIRREKSLKYWGWKMWEIPRVHKCAGNELGDGNLDTGGQNDPVINWMIWIQAHGYHPTMTTTVVVLQGKLCKTHLTLHTRHCTVRKICITHHPYSARSQKKDLHTSYRSLSLSIETYTYIYHCKLDTWHFILKSAQGELMLLNTMLLSPLLCIALHIIQCTIDWQ